MFARSDQMREKIKSNWNSRNQLSLFSSKLTNVVRSKWKIGREMQSSKAFLVARRRCADEIRGVARVIARLTNMWWARELSRQFALLTNCTANSSLCSAVWRFDSMRKPNIVVVTWHESDRLHHTSSVMITFPKQGNSSFLSADVCEGTESRSPTRLVMIGEREKKAAGQAEWLEIEANLNPSRLGWWILNEIQLDQSQKFLAESGILRGDWAI